jgi:glucose dehydrogenase
MMTRGRLAIALLLTAAGTGLAPAQTPVPVNGTTIAPHPLASYTPVTDQALRNPDPSDWIMMRGNYQGWGFSTLNQINTSNVKGLQLVWARTMETGINEATPLIYKGVMFLGNPNDVIQAIDGPVTVTACSTEENQCEQFSKCNVRDPLWKVRERILSALGECTIAELAAEPSPVPGTTSRPAVFHTHQ